MATSPRFILLSYSLLAAITLQVQGRSVLQTSTEDGEAASASSSGDDSEPILTTIKSTGSDEVVESVTDSTIEEIIEGEGGDVASVESEIPSCSWSKKTKITHSSKAVVDRSSRVSGLQKCCEWCRDVEECFAWNYNSKKPECTLLKAGDYKTKRNSKFSSGRLY